MSLHPKRDRRKTGPLAGLGLAIGMMAVVLGCDTGDRPRATRDDSALARRAGTSTNGILQGDAAVRAAVRPPPPIRDGVPPTGPLLYAWEPYVDLVVIAKAVGEFETVFNTASGQPVSQSERRTPTDWQGVRPVVFEVEEVLADRGAWSDARWIVVRVFDDEPEYLPNPCAIVERSDVVSGARGILLLTPESLRASPAEEPSQSPVQLSWMHLHASSLKWADEHAGRTLASGLELWLRLDGPVARTACSGATNDMPVDALPIDEIRAHFARQR